MNILITGAAGFIGSHTCEALVAGGHRVTGVDSFDDYLYPAEVKRRVAEHLVANLPGARFHLVEGDIRDAGTMGRLIGEQEVDVVCHLAALAGVRPSIAEPIRYVQTNLEGTAVILEAMRVSRRARLVFASSSSVYGAKASEDLRKVEAFREEDPCLTPASPYAATKRAGELLCSTYRDLFGIGALCLRFFTVYGPRQRPDMAIHKFVRAVALGQSITLFGDGSSRRDYTFISDIVAGVVAACDRVEPGQYAIYNLGGTATTSLADLVRLIEGVVGAPAIINWAPDQPGDVPVTYAAIELARRDLAFAPQVTIEDGLRRFWIWLQSEWAARGRPIP